jgi:hypothetical protein
MHVQSLFKLCYIWKQTCNILNARNNKRILFGNDLEKGVIKHLKSTSVNLTLQ